MALPCQTCFKRDEKPRPGLLLRQQGYKPKHPIIIVPGFVTSGLELWAGKECASSFFQVLCYLKLLWSWTLQICLAAQKRPSWEGSMSPLNRGISILIAHTIPRAATNDTELSNAIFS